MFVARCALASLALLSTAAAQTSLAELAKLARARADRSLPAQQKALQPYWPDLQLDYRINQQVVDGRIDDVVALGDGIVPLLLERLQPNQGGDANRNLAANCRRVLEKLDPASFIDALGELANGTNEIGRAEAIRLLGLANLPQSAILLSELLDRLAGEEKRLCVHSLRLLKAVGPATKVAQGLASNDRLMREEVLAYLVAAKPPQVAGLVLEALATEQDTKLLPAFIEYFAGTVVGHDATARALVDLLDGDRIDWADRKRLITVLATVAPAGHDPTVRRLLKLVEEGEVSSLAVQAAVTLRTLGEKQGVTRLRRQFDEQMRKPARRRDPQLMETRGTLSFAIEEYGDALADFEKMQEFAGNQTENTTLVRRALIWQMRCEARRKKVPALQKLMKASGLSSSEIEAIGADDPVFAQTLQQDKMKQFLQGLHKDGR